jgi:hypothetical protein
VFFYAADVDPTAVLPSGYIDYHFLGSIVRASATIVPFDQRPGGVFVLRTPGVVLGSTNPGTSAVSMTLTNCPTGLKVEAMVGCLLASDSSGNALLYVSSLDSTDVAPSVANGYVTTAAVNTANYRFFAPKSVWTNTSGQVRTRLSASSTNDQVILSNFGWIHPRGRDA